MTTTVKREKPIKHLEIVSLKMVKERTPEYEIRISSPDCVIPLLVKFIGDQDREHCVVLMLDTRNNVNAMHTVSIGSINSSIVHPREVFKVALLHNAASIIVAHNHPSGDPSPSPEDISITERLQEAGKIIGIELLDHIILGDNGLFASLKTLGFMD